MILALIGTFIELWFITFMFAKNKGKKIHIIKFIILTLLCFELVNVTDFIFLRIGSIYAIPILSIDYKYNVLDLIIIFKYCFYLILIEIMIMEVMKLCLL